MAIQIIGFMVLVIILVITVVLGFEYFSNFYQELQNALNNTGGNDSTGEVFQANDGEEVCNLEFHVHGEFDEWDFSALRVRFGESTSVITGETIQANFPPVGEYYWRNCYEKSGDFNPFSLIFYDKYSGIKSAPALAFGTALGAGEEIAVQLKFTDDEGNEIDATKDRKLRKTIKLPNGAFKTPLVFEKTWIINDIKRQDYDVSIFMGRQINNLDAGVPYIYNVLK